MTDDILLIDGSLGEGGGQILRTSVSLAVALWSRGPRGGRILRIENIRARRPKSGLQPQHLAAAKAAAAICSGRLEGAEIGSTALVFQPGQVRAGRYRFDIGTAGSSTLVLQTVLPALLLAKGDSEVVITGGTHNPMAPCFEYVREVFATLAAAAGAAFALDMERMGFYPAGGGKIHCQVRGVGDGANLAPLRLLSRGGLRHVAGLSVASTSLPGHIIQRQAAQAGKRLLAAGLKHDVEQAALPTSSPGTAVFLRAVYSRSVAGFFALGKLGKPAEKVADEAVDQLLQFAAADGAVDPHAADQLVTLLALSPEESEFTTTCVTDHLLTNAEVVRKVADREVVVEGEAGQPGKVTIRGISR